MWLTILIICIYGTTLHFQYEWSNHNKFFALFAAVNESTWEHIKMGLTSTLIFGVIDFILDGYGHNIPALAVALLAYMIVIPAIFYTYTAFTKKSLLPVDICTFYFSVFVSQWLYNYILNIDILTDSMFYGGIILLIIDIILYLTLTYKAPHIFLFEDPITHKYGIKGHPCFKGKHKHNHGKKKHKH